MGVEVLIPLFAIFSIFLVPILGVTVILTTKFALKPLAETIASALRESGASHGQVGPHQLQELGEHVYALTEEVQRLREVQDFDRKLLENREEKSPTS